MRKIIIGKVETYNKVKKIECQIDPFYNDMFDPINPRYVIKKGIDEKEWRVYEGVLSQEKHHVYDYKYIGTDTLQQCKKYVIGELTKITNDLK
jgi:hypothetical protein